MAVGNIVYITVGYTESDNASFRKGYPIKRKYKQTENTQSPKFPSSYTEVSDQLYWFPFTSLGASDENYIPYETADEYGWSDDQEKRAPEIPYTNPRTTKYDDFSTGHKIVYGGSIYVATRYTFDWGETKFDVSINPYKTARIRKWRRFTDTSNTWTQYWYHPLLRRFYTLAETDTLQELPDFDEPSQSRWSRFIGDSQDMNLENFTFAQIRELISTGSALVTATAAVQSLEERSMAALSSPAQPDGNNTRTSGTQTSGTFIVNSQAGGQNGQGLSLPDNLPKMIQRMTTGAAGVKTILDTYIFNLRPNNVSYSNIGITWTEVDRVNNFPLVDYRNNKLMRISFEFVVEAQTTGVSSLYESCEARLQQVQRMANRPELVVFTNFDSLFGEGVFNEASAATYREWAIFDMSINSIQRTPSGVNTSPGAISRATVSMTIQEVRLTPDQVIFMPKLRKTPGIPNIPTPENEPEPCIEYATDTVVEVNSKLKYSPCWYKNRGLPVPSS
jgi:hypothetical protein